LALGWEKDKDDENIKPWKDLRLMDLSTLVLATFSGARHLILYAEEDEETESLERGRTARNQNSSLRSKTR